MNEVGLPDRAIPFAAFIPDPADRDGWEAPASEPAAQGFVPCLKHGMGRRYPGTMVCHGCVIDGVFTEEQLRGEASAEPVDEVTAAADRMRDERLRIENQSEDLRRREIDFAIRSRDVARLHELGAGRAAFEEVERALARPAGEVERDHLAEPERPRADPLDPSLVGIPAGGLAVGPGRLSPDGRTADDTPRTGLHDRDLGEPIQPALGARTVVEGDRTPAGDGPALEPFRVVGVDWP